MAKYQTATLQEDGPVQITEDGIEVVGITSTYDHEMTDPTSLLTRTARMTGIETGAAPGWGVGLHSGDGSVNLLDPYGGFEQSTLAGWTQTLATDGTWSENTTATFVREGTISAKWTVSASTSHGTLTLTTRIYIRGGNGYRFVGWVWSDIVAGTALSDSNFSINWYAEDTGGTAIRSDVVTINTTPNAWQRCEGKFNAPLTASYAEIVIDVNGYQATAIYFDELSLIEADVDMHVNLLGTAPTLDQLQVEEGDLAGSADPRTMLMRPTRSGVPQWRDKTGNLWQGLGINKWGRHLVRNTVTKTAIYSITLNANALGQNGFIGIWWFYDLFNNSGAGRTFIIDVDLGGVNILTYTTANIPAAASNRIGRLYFRMYNDGADPFQETMLRHWLSAATAVNAVAAAGPADGMVYNVSNVSTAVDNTLVISITLSAASSNYFVEFGGAEVFGPVLIDETRIN